MSRQICCVVWVEDKMRINRGQCPGAEKYPGDPWLGCQQSKRFAGPRARSSCFTSLALPTFPAPS